MKLIVDNIEKSYKDNTVISGFSYEFVGGNVYKIEGRNGTGKSTLLRILSGLEQCDGGQIMVHDFKRQELIKIELEKVARN